MIQVGTERAFSGSGWAPKFCDKKLLSGKSKNPFKYKVCTCGFDKAGKMAVAAANVVNPSTNHTIGEYVRALWGVGRLAFSLAARACRKAMTVTRLVIVNKDSADPWSQSESARDTPYCNFAAIAAGIVKKTKSKHVANPTVTPLGVSFSGTFKKYKNARYGRREAPKKGPATASEMSESMVSHEEREARLIVVASKFAIVEVVVAVVVAVVMIVASGSNPIMPGPTPRGAGNNRLVRVFWWIAKKAAGA